MTDPAPARGLLISNDLFFSSKVTGAADALGLKVDVVGDPSQASSMLAESAYRGLFVDLSLPGLSVVELMESLPTEGRPPVIAFGPHVQTARLEEARKAGCDRVLSRGQFDARLAEILKETLEG